MKSRKKGDQVQVEKEAAMTNERHGWHKIGDAWAYRRSAYRRMAEELGGSYLQLYQQVFARCDSRAIIRIACGKLEKSLPVDIRHLDSCDWVAESQRRTRHMEQKFTPPPPNSAKVAVH